MKTGASVYRGEPKDGRKPDVTMTVEDDDFIALAMGQLQPEAVGPVTMFVCLFFFFLTCPH